MSSEARVLVVDDEEGITDLVSMALRYEGLEVEVAHSGREALGLLQTFRPQLMLLDVMLPDLDGFEVIRRMAGDQPRVPVIFLTARGDLDDKLRGFTLGGDDYVTKPFNLDELVARIRAVLRRSGHDQTADPDVLVFADLVIDIGAHEVRRHDVLITLTATEFNVLRYLTENARRVVSKTDILDNVWDYGRVAEPNSVETYISYLRKKVDEFDPPLIHTVRGVGYSLRLPRE